MNLLSLVLLASDLTSGWLFVAGLSDWGRLLFNFAFFLAAVVFMVTLSGKHLADLRLSQVVLFFVVNVLLATLDVEVISGFFNNHLLGFDSI